MDYWKAFEDFTGYLGTLLTNYFITMKRLMYRFLENDLGIDVDFHFHQDKMSILLTAAISIFIPFIFIKIVCYCCPCYENEDDVDGANDMSDKESGVLERDRLNARRWLRQAECDLDSANNDFEVDKPAPEWVCYKCQQSCEKAIKAYLLSQQLSGSITHDLTVLAEETGDHTLLRYATKLQGVVGFITRMRYPDLLPYPKIPRDMYSVKDAKTAIEVTETIISYVKTTCFNEHRHENGSGEPNREDNFSESE